MQCIDCTISEKLLNNLNDYDYQIPTKYFTLFFYEVSKISKMSVDYRCLSLDYLNTGVLESLMLLKEHRHFGDHNIV